MEPSKPIPGDFLSDPWGQNQRLLNESEHLKARLAQLTHIDGDGCRGLADIVTLARRYLPEEHREVVVRLAQLAYIRGKVDGVEAAPAALPLVLSVCPTCRGGR